VLFPVLTDEFLSFQSAVSIELRMIAKPPNIRRPRRTCHEAFAEISRSPIFHCDLALFKVGPKLDYLQLCRALDQHGALHPTYMLSSGTR